MKIRKWTFLFLAALFLAAAPPCCVRAAEVVSDAAGNTAESRKEGLLRENGKYYYYEDGVCVRNRLEKIEGAKYYFTEDGSAAVSTLKTVDGKKYYFRANGKAVTKAWKTIGKKKYYFLSGGSAAVGSRKIGGKYYVFRESGALCQPKKKSLIRVKDVTYYVNAKGRPVPGWVYLEKTGKVYYVRKNGSCAADTTVEGIRFTKKGYAANTDQAFCKILAREFIAEHTSSKMSRREKFRKCFRYIMAYTNYTGENPQAFPKKNWQYKAAVEMFTTDLSGDCHGIASTVAAVAKELGYQPYVITAWEGHSFVMVDGKYYDNMYGAKFGTSTHAKYTLRQKFKF